jgi:hypothetical protein
MRWAGHVARMLENRIAYMLLVGYIGYLYVVGLGSEDEVRY